VQPVVKRKNKVNEIKYNIIITNNNMIFKAHTPPTVKLKRGRKKENATDLSWRCHGVCFVKDDNFVRRTRFSTVTNKHIS